MTRVPDPTVITLPGPSPLRILAVADTHSVREAERVLCDRIGKAKPHVLVHAGDWSIHSDYASGMGRIFEGARKAGIHVLYVRGDHEFETPEFGGRIPGVHDLNEAIVIIGDTLFFGASWPHESRRGLLERYEALAAHVKHAKVRKRVLVSHEPPQGWRPPSGEDLGSLEVRHLLDATTPDLAIFGHYHTPDYEPMGSYLGKTELLNPGAYGAVVEV